jgi:hypothetical protein
VCFIWHCCEYSTLHNINGKVIDLLITPEGKRPLGRPRSRREDNIKMGVQEIGWCGLD